jgi:hypothetical protein
MQNHILRLFRAWVADWKRVGFLVAFLLLFLVLPSPLFFIGFLIGVPWVLWLYWRSFKQWLRARR